MKHTLKNPATHFAMLLMALAMAFTFLACEDKKKTGAEQADADADLIRTSEAVAEKASKAVTFKTVKIGEQTWMAENLNLEIAGSKCYNDDPANCDKYGRLYDWATAMALPSSCNSSECASQIQPKHTGICPEGWHIPSNADWEQLLRYVDDNKGTESPYSSKTAGKYLKSTEGWYDEGNGQDFYGFAALPGGDSRSGLWLSSNEYIKNYPFGVSMNYYDKAVNLAGSSSKSAALFSVRCVKDFSEGNDGVRPSDGSIAITYEGQKYKAVKIGEQTWMAENLKYNAKDSKCFEDTPANCEEYGRLYDWATAMALPSSCNSSECASQIQPKHTGICPKGWHIPNNADWDQLLRYVDGNKGKESPYNSEVAGKHLKATDGWADASNGRDTYDFAALPGLDGPSDEFNSSSQEGKWWSSSENDSNIAYYRNMSYYSEGVSWGNLDKKNLYSVRCIKD
jgi:uncharacterized protein (TIGR02145 family)